MLDLIINHNSYIGLIIFLGAMTKTLGKRFSMTRQEWQSLSYLNQYGQLVFGFPTAVIAISLPYIAHIVSQSISTGATVIVTLIAVSFFLALISLIMGVVMCIGGPRILKADGKSWR